MTSALLRTLAPTPLPRRPDPSHRPDPARRLRAVATRFPATLTALAVVVLLGALAGTFVRPLAESGVAAAASYGWTALLEGRWWTVLGGAGFAVTPVLYVPVLLSLALGLGLAERAVGSLRAIGLWAAGHLVGVLGGLALIGLTDPGLRPGLDAGPSGGSLFAGYLGAAALAPRWRSVVRGGLLAYALTWFVVVHHVADTVHLVAVLAAAALASLTSDAWVAGRRRQPAGADPGAVLDNLVRHGGGTLGWMHTWPGMQHLVTPRGHVAYRVHAGVALALGDPVGDAGFRREAPALFAAHCRARGLRPAWFAASSATAGAAGGHRLVVATDSLLDLPGLEFRGKAWQDVRTSRNRAAREGIRCWIGPLAAQSPEVRAQVRALSQGWLAEQRTPELGFTLGGIDQALDPAVRVALALDEQGTVHGVTSWLPVHGPGGRVRGWTLDVMRRGHGFGPVIEFLISEAAMTFRAEGAELLSLSGAPLSGGEDDRTPRLSVQGLLDSSATLLDPLYGFTSLHAFKRKFSPRTEPMFLVHDRRRDLPRIGLAVVLAYLRTPEVPRRDPAPAALAPVEHEPVAA